MKDRIIVYGILCDEKYSKMIEISRRVYSVNGLCPTIHTFGGGNQEIKIAYEEDNLRSHKRKT